jgi:EAL domain-containing protein (putative c-di-GMP-specific phosphodiesterase class I)
MSLLRQGRAELAAARLCDPAATRAKPIEVSLAQLTTRLQSLVHRLSRTHPVTGLPTREVICEIIAADTAGADAAPRLLAVFRFADFDRLAAFDQGAADAALRAFSDRLTGAMRPIHGIGQVDRDCICIWFRGEISPDEAGAELRALAYVATQDLPVGPDTLTPSVEVGSAAFPRDGREPAQLVIRATVALARPKVSSLGELTIVQPRPLEEARRQFDLEQDLTKAIAEDQLTLVFQPLVSLSRRRLVGAEALLRWDHPTMGAVSPARFVPLVELIGLSDRYGLWILNAACREARRWQDAGLADLKVAVNLSAHQLLDPLLGQKVARTLKRHRLDPARLEFELTETAAMADAERTRQVFAELRAMGVTLAIDDFGSGYSSLSYLKNLPFDKLKIDREFVTAIEAHADSRAICTALLELGRGLGLRVLAEGVETEQEVETLRGLGCDLFQGYFFSKPLAPEDFLDLARNPRRLPWPKAKASSPPSSPVECVP